MSNQGYKVGWKNTERPISYEEHVLQKKRTLEFLMLIEFWINNIEYTKENKAKFVQIALDNNLEGCLYEEVFEKVIKIMKEQR